MSRTAVQLDHGSGERTGTKKRCSFRGKKCSFRGNACLFFHLDTSKKHFNDWKTLTLRQIVFINFLKKINIKVFSMVFLFRYNFLLLCCFRITENVSIIATIQII